MKPSTSIAHLFRICAVYSCLALPSTAQTTIVVPSAYESQPGEQATSLPFGWTISGQVWHFVYDSSYFPSGSILIDRVAFRPDEGLSAWGPYLYPQLEITVATSRNDWTAQSYDPVFANNILSSTTFLNGSYTLPQGNSTTVPRPFALSFGHPTGHLYDSGVGHDLIIEVRMGQPAPTTFGIDSTRTGVLAGSYGNLLVPNSPSSNIASPGAVPILEVTYRRVLEPDFDATPRTGLTPLVVNFTDQSTTLGQGITSWAWDLDGDGSVDSTVRNPSFTYTREGTFDVTLSVTDLSIGTATTTKRGFIQTTSGLQVDFDASPRSGLTHLQVNFTDLSTTTTTGITSWAWDLDGDGVIDSTQQNPAFTYLSVGSFDVTLSVTDPILGSLSLTKRDFIQTTFGLQVDFDATPRTGRTPLLVQFADLSTTTTMGISAWAWDFDGDGTTDSTQQNPAFTYLGVGSYDVTLSVTDSVLGSLSLTKRNFIQTALGLQVDFDATPRAGFTPMHVQFTDLSTTTVGGITSWAWDFDGDGSIDSTVRDPSHTYALEGAYDVSLTVTDAFHGSRSLTRTGFIRASFGVEVDFGASPRAGMTPLVVQFNDMSRTSGSGFTSWAWDLDGDQVIDSTVRNPSFTYLAPGSYDVTLTATDASRGTAGLTKYGFVMVTGFPYYVDSQNGSNVTGDGSSAAPWRTVTFATSQGLVSGDILILRSGHYDSTSGETFPLRIPVGVSVASFGGGVRIDAGAAAKAISLEGPWGTMSSATFSNLTIVGATAIEVLPGIGSTSGSSSEFLLDRCVTQGSISIRTPATGQPRLRVRNCHIQAAGPALVVDGPSVVGEITACTIQTSGGDGIRVRGPVAGGAVSLRIHRNELVANTAGGAGIRYEAMGATEITSNRLRGYRWGLDILGPLGAVEDNDVEGHSGIRVGMNSTTPSVRIVDNRIRATEGFGCEFDVTGPCDEILVEGNQVHGLGADRYAMGFLGSGSLGDLRIRENRVDGFFQGAVRTWVPVDRIDIERNFLFGIGGVDTGVVLGPWNERCRIHSNLIGRFGATIVRATIDESYQSTLPSFELSQNLIGEGLGHAVELDLIHATRSPRITRNTIAANRGTGLWLRTIPGWNQSVVIEENVLAGNGLDCFGITPARDLAEYNLVQDGSCALGGTNLVVDPDFQDPRVGDYSLRCTSPCVDAGRPSVGCQPLVETDLRDLVRYVDGDLDGVERMDIGCYEYQTLDVRGRPAPGNWIEVVAKGSPTVDRFAFIYFGAFAWSPPIVMPPVGCLHINVNPLIRMDIVASPRNCQEGGVMVPIPLYPIGAQLYAQALSFRGPIPFTPTWTNVVVIDL
ncbi:MAG: PKD domain-containing protein [Planctomycetes bacterium]|nr:PKD domain-containing protein [Planctomycetota bacterium]